MPSDTFTGRERHCTVVQLREVLDTLQDDDIVCTALPPSGHLPVYRNNVQIGVIAIAPADFDAIEVPPSAAWEPFDAD